MGIRIISALLGIPLLIAVLYYGNWIFTLAVAIVCVIGMHEFYGALGKSQTKPFGRVGYIAGLVLILTIGFYGESAAILLPAILICCTIACFIMMILSKTARIIDLAVTILGIVYVSVFGSLLLMIRMGSYGQYFIWLVFLLAWLGDTFAYFIGINLGRHKLCPEISPKKSVEGAIGGLIGSVIGAFVFGAAIGKSTGIGFNWVHYLVIGAGGGLLAQMGDLSASLIKRAAGVKDFGNIIPGHGGILDRFDSILFTAPIVYYYMRLFIR
jgi:phosphatidate cytidylyltransferase